jgi:hypothetical protein
MQMEFLPKNYNLCTPGDISQHYQSCETEVPYKPCVGIVAEAEFW